jgi:hypothetical protein
MQCPGRGRQDLVTQDAADELHDKRIEGPDEDSNFVPTAPFSPPTRSRRCFGLELITHHAAATRLHTPLWSRPPVVTCPPALSSSPSPSRPPPVALALPHPSRVGTSTDASLTLPLPGAGPPGTDVVPPATAACPPATSHWWFFSSLFEFILNVIKFG